MRRGPREHRFRYYHNDRMLTEVIDSDEVPPGPAASRLQFISCKAQECAGVAYDLAIDRERIHYFMRASEDESGNRRRRQAP